MRSSSNYTVVAIATTLTAGLLAAPGAAYATGTVSTLTANQMATALQHVATASTAAGKKGWKTTETATLGPSSSLSASFVVDPVGGVMFDKVRLTGTTVSEYVVDHKGTYLELTDPISRRAVAMMHRPDARYEFLPDHKLSLARYLTDVGPAPATLLREDVRHPGTKTVHPDGSADYRFKSQDGEALTIYVTPAGTLHRVKVQGKAAKAVVTFAYGTQHPGMPPSSGTITAAELARGISYLAMADNVRAVTEEGADQARRAAHGHTITISALRKAARHAAKDFNTTLGMPMIKVASVAGGAQLSATNPWTHKTVTYTVKASGKKTIIGKK